MFNKEEKLEKVRHMKTYFFISFWISFVLLLVSSLLCIIFADAQIAISEKYFNLDPNDYGMILVMVMGLWKVLIIQFTLIPGVALWLIERHCACKCNK